MMNINSYKTENFLPNNIVNQKVEKKIMTQDEFMQSKMDTRAYEAYKKIGSVKDAA